MLPTADLGSATQGVWSRRQALEVVSSATIQSLVRSGTWQHVLTGVYADGGYALSPLQLAFAAVLASGGGDGPSRAVAGLRSAARAWGLPLIDDHDPATGRLEHLEQDVLVWRRLDKKTDAQSAYQLRRHRPASRAEIVQHPSGLWLTSPLRTALDCAAFLLLEPAVCLIDAALQRGLFSVAVLQQAAAERGTDPGSRRIRAAIALADGRAESPAESLARLVLQPVIPSLVPQVRIRDGGGRVVARADLGDEDVRLAVETDGRRWHAGEQMAARDHRRDRRTGALGWTTERVVWWELRREQDALRQRVLAAHRRLQVAAA